MKSRSDKRVAWDWDFLSTVDDINQETYILTRQQAVALLNVTRHMAWQSRWEGNITRDEIQAFAAEVAFRLMNPVPSLECDPNECFELPPFAPQINWFPVNPYGDQTTKKFFWNLNIWDVVNITLPSVIGSVLQGISDILGLTNLLQEVSGVVNGDVITTIAHLALQPNVSSVFEPPGFSVDFNGTGVIELHLLSVPAGGRALVTLDNNPFDGNTFEDIIEVLSSVLDPNDSVIELDRDIIAIPSEIGSGATIHEIEVNTQGAHTVYVHFLPVVDDSIGFVRFGGGLRKIVLCGFDNAQELNVPEFRFTADCILEFSEDGGATFQPVPGWTENAFNCFQGKSANEQIVDAITAQQDAELQAHIDGLEAQYDGSTPQSVFPDIPVTAANADVDDDNVLCYALEGWVKLYSATKQQKIASSEKSGNFFDAITDAAEFIWNEVKSYAGSLWDALTGLVDPVDASIALKDKAQQEDLACCMWESLRTQPLTETTWSAALAACENENDIGKLQKDDADNTRAYLYFLDVYNAAVQRELGGESLQCNCDLAWCFEWDFINSPNTWDASGIQDAATIHVVGSGFTGSGNDADRITIFKDFGGALSNVTSIVVEVRLIASMGNGFVSYDTSAVDGELVPSNERVQPSNVDNTGDLRTVSFNNQPVFTTFTYAIETPGVFSQPRGHIERIRFRGTGLNPFGADNC